MRLSARNAGLIAGLLYPVIFERDPMDGVSRALEVVVAARAMKASPEDFLAAVRAGLASATELAKLLPQPHSEESVRRYLVEIERRLSSAGPSLPPS